MQPVVVMVFAAWVGGISIGLVSAEAAVVGMIVAAVVALSFIVRLSLPVSVTLGTLVVLGFLYGNTSLVQEEHRICSLNQLGSVSVMDRPQVRVSDVRYVVAGEDNCGYLLYGERWPVYGQGDRLGIAEGRRQTVADVAEDLPGYARYLRRHGLSGVILYPDSAVIAATSVVSHRYDDLNARVGRIFPEPAAAVVRAMILGDQYQVPESILQSWRVSGISHALSISGLHISLLTGLLVVALRPLPLSPRWRVGLALLLLWLYVWFVGAPVSAVRAGVFWSVTLLAFRLGWLVSLPTALLLALTLFATATPLVLQDIGWQLSVMGVLGIFLALFAARPFAHRLVGWWRRAGLALLVSVGATLATWPLVSLYFGVISPVSPVSNLLIIPAVPVVLVGGMLGLVISFVSTPAAVLVGIFVQAVVWWMNVVAAWCARLPLGWFTYTVSLPQLLFYYLALTIVLIGLVYWQGRSWREIWE